MEKLKLITDKDNPILRAKNEPIKKFDKNLRNLVEEMKKIMKKAKGLGIAAPQIGKNLQIAIVAFYQGEMNELIMPMMNLKLLWHSKETTLDEEGCLSIPGCYAKVRRWKHIRVEFQSLDEQRQVLTLSDMNARIVLHELDHLNGILFVDRVEEGRVKN